MSFVVVSIEESSSHSQIGPKRIFSFVLLVLDFLLLFMLDICYIEAEYI